MREAHATPTHTSTARQSRTLRLRCCPKYVSSYHLPRNYTDDSPVSAFLAGVRRSTGLTYVCSSPRAALPNTHKQSPVLIADSPSVKPDQFAETPGVKKWIDNYLWVGETVMDQSVAFFAASSYFERKR